MEVFGTPSAGLDFEQRLGAFGGYLQRQGRSARTKEKYVASLRGFGSWLDGRDPVLLSATDVDAFLDHWSTAFEQRSGRRPSAATYRSQIGALRAFYAYADRFGLLRGAAGEVLSNPMRLIESPRVPQRPIDFLTPDEDRALLDYPCQPSEQIVVHLLRHAGLRVGEAHAVRIADVSLLSGQESIRIRSSKTPAGQRVVPVVPELAVVLDVRIRELRSRGLYRLDGPLLATGNGTPMATTQIWRTTKRVAARAGVRPVACTCGSRTVTRHDRSCPRTVSGENVSTISPHTLRRTFASSLLNQGLRIEIVSKLLGHRSTAVTEAAYAQLLDQTIRAELMTALGH